MKKNCIIRVDGNDHIGYGHIRRCLALTEALNDMNKLIKELQYILSYPYEEQSFEISQKYNRLKPRELFNNGGISHYSCSS